MSKQIKNFDKYYTNKDIVEKCFEFINQYLEFDKENDLCIEPSAGNGSFIENIKLNFNNYEFYDIKPEHKEIKEQDYLNLNIDDYLNFKYNIHIIGNPPFGRQSSNAIKFIKYSSKFCNSISFILPKSFKKNSLKKSIPLNFHLIFEYDLPNNSFTFNNEIYNVNCIFQIWIKKNIQRELPKKLNPINFKFVKKNDNPDISFRRVGVYAGNIDKEIKNKSIQSHYFIKFNKNLKEDELDELKKIEYEHKNNTTGPKSISKEELIEKFNNLLI